MIILLLIFAFMVYIQVPSLLKNKYWKELITFSAFFIAAFILSILYVMDINIPSPIKGVKYIIEDVFKIKY